MVFHTKNLKKTFFSYSKMGGLPLTDKYPFKIWEVSFVCTYWFVRILWIGKPKNVSKWVEIVKIWVRK